MGSAPARRQSVTRRAAEARSLSARGSSLSPRRGRQGCDTVLVGWQVAQAIPDADVGATPFEPVPVDPAVWHPTQDADVASRPAAVYAWPYVLIIAATLPATSAVRRAQRAFLSAPLALTPFAAHQPDTDAWQRCERGTACRLTRSR